MKTKATKRICIALIVIFVCSLLACLLQTNAFKVKIKDMYIVTEDQQYLHALAFIPKSATAENPCPVVITSHGWLNSAEVQDAASIELSRRGIMVIAMDAYSHGMSSNTPVSTIDSTTKDGMGMVSLVEYVASGIMNFVDTDRIGIMGHSMGGMNTMNTVKYYGALYNEAIAAAQAEDSEGGAEITEAEQTNADSVFKIDAALPTGVSPGGMDWTLVHCNYGDLYGRLEEGGASSSTGTANLIGTSTEALTMINSVDPTVTYVEEGVFYGDKDAGTLRVLYQPVTTHPLIHFSPGATKDVIEFFTYCWDIDAGISSSNQIFLIKETINGIAMVALFSLLVPFAAVLVKLPCFAELDGKEGPRVPALTTKAKKRRFWFGWLIGGVISFFTAWLTVKTVGYIFTSGFMTMSTFFGAPTMNVVMMWTLLNAIWGFFWFWFNFKRDKAAGERTDEMIGWKIGKKEFWKTLLLAAVIIGLIYIIVWFCKWLFNTDFRFWTPAIKTFNADKLVSYIQYLPVFFAFYLANSLIVNGACRFEGANEKRNLLLCGFGNILGCGTMWALQYGTLVLTGTCLWPGGPDWVYVLVINFCIWQLFLAPFFLRNFYKITGKNWLGPLVVSSMYVLSGIMHTAISTYWF